MNDPKKNAFQSLSWLPFISFLFYMLSKCSRPIVGLHPWKQSDSLAQMDIAANLISMPSIFHDYSGSLIFWDTPIYQFLVGTLSSPLRIDPLIGSRVLNLALLFISAFCLIRTFSSLVNKFSVSLYLFFLCANPFILHYYASPIPDVLAIAFGACGLLFFVEYFVDRQESIFIPVSCLFLILSTIIKSPIGFFFYLMILSFCLVKKLNFFAQPRLMIPYSSMGFVLLLTAFSIEKFRSSLLSTSRQAASSLWERDPSLYFGNFADRFSLDTILIYFKRFLIFGGDFSVLRISFGLTLLTAMILAISLSSEVRKSNSNIYS